MKNPIGKFFRRSKEPADPLPKLGIPNTRKNKLTPVDAEFLSELLQTKQMFVVTDPHQADHPIVYASDMFYEFTGYKPDDILGKNCRFLQRDYRQQQEANLDRVRTALVLTSKDAKPVSVCLYNFKKDGTPFINQFFMTPLVNHHGDTIFFVGIQQQVFALTDGQDESNHAYVFRKQQAAKPETPATTTRTSCSESSSTTSTS
eukprot:c2153_g1_i1.p1 GENE.c2153_g1_i1~~c2153_g1_i1.p1  ORF type:complete len:203 (+),score=65.93 c2153_g1_i1:67-675(+)